MVTRGRLLIGAALVVVMFALAVFSVAAFFFALVALALVVLWRVSRRTAESDSSAAPYPTPEPQVRPTRVPPRRKRIARPSPLTGAEAGGVWPPTPAARVGVPSAGAIAPIPDRRRESRPPALSTREIERKIVPTDVVPKDKPTSRPTTPATGDSPRVALRTSVEPTQKLESPPPPPARTPLPLPTRPSGPELGQPWFAGPGSSVVAYGQTLDEPLIYVCDRKVYRDADASLLCLRRPIEPPKQDIQGALGYWPEVARLWPSQLGEYVQWLASGRKDSAIDVGYVFLYFYGLERRVLVDCQDFAAIAREVSRLMNVYADSRSLRNYGVGLILRMIVTGRLVANESVFSRLDDVASNASAETLHSVVLGHHARTGEPLSADWALRMVRRFPAAKAGIVVERTAEAASTLFANRYAEAFPDGVKLAVSERPLRVTYEAASPTIMALPPYSEQLSPVRWPRANGWSSASKRLLSLWNACVDDLRPAARRQGDSTEASLSSYFALPEDLRGSLPHPAQLAWDEAASEAPTVGSFCLIPVSKLAAIAGIDQKPKLSMADSRLVSTLVRSFQRHLEPDPELTGERLEWVSHVSVFTADDSESAATSPLFRLAAIALALLTQISVEDGEEGREVALSRVDHLAAVIGLPPQDATRLRAQAARLTIDELPKVERRKIEEIAQSSAVRELLTDLMVEVAGATAGVSNREASSIRRLAGRLGISREDIDRRLGTPLEPEAKAAELQPVSPLPLDLDRIRKLRRESAEVSEFLRQTISDSDVDAEEPELRGEATSEVPDVGAARISVASAAQPPAHENEATAMPVLPAELLAMAKELASRPAWTTSELSACARRHGSTLAVAVDSINTWADVKLGDWVLTLDGGGYVVNTGLLAAAGESDD